MAHDFALSEHPVIAFVPTRDPERAKTFYRDLLGLNLTSEQLPFALVFDAFSVTLRIVVVKELTPPPYTTLGWEVPDIEQAVGTLAKRASISSDTRIWSKMTSGSGRRPAAREWLGSGIQTAIR